VPTENLQNLLPKVASQLASPRDSSTGTQSETSGFETRGLSLSPLSVETLFRVSSRRWAHKFEKTFSDPKARDVWRIDLIGMGITDELLQVGLHRSANLEWPPSPAEFAKLCRASAADHGLPTVSEAYRAATHNRWIHPVVYEAARRVGVFELANRSEARSRPEFEREYAAVCTEFMAGNTFAPAPVPAVEHKRRPWQRATPDEAKARCDALRKAIGPIPAPRKADEPAAPLNDTDIGIIEEAAQRYRRQA
jgi:hypothetical protein